MQTLTPSALGLPQISEPALLVLSVTRVESRSYMKRDTCATHGCVRCPYFRDNGSC